MEGVVQQASGNTAKWSEGLQYLQSAACALRSNAGEPEAENPAARNGLGCARVRSVQAASAISERQSRGDAEARLPPPVIAELETSAQGNVTQHSDACSAQRPSTYSLFAASHPTSQEQK